jgi:hypothetical protein
LIIILVLVLKGVLEGVVMMSSLEQSTLVMISKPFFTWWVVFPEDALQFLYLGAISSILSCNDVIDQSYPLGFKVAAR